MVTARHAEHSWRWSYRMAAGAFGGLVGGLVFGILMAFPGVLNQAFFGGTGMWTLLGETFLPAEQTSFHLFFVWLLHSAMSVLFGIVFALLVRPTFSWRATVPLAVGYGALLWFVGPFLLLRTLTGTPLALDLTAVANLVGHLLYGAALGLVYPAFEHEEERMADGTASFRHVPPRE